jgi:hypothetical protein
VNSKKQTAARPQNGRPLQYPPPTCKDGFVAAVSSRDFRDGTGIITIELNHYGTIISLPKVITKNLDGHRE